jgi:hypothetical protein
VGYVTPGPDLAAGDVPRDEAYQAMDWLLGWTTTPRRIWRASQPGVTVYCQQIFVD